MVTKSILLKEVPIELYKKILNDKLDSGEKSIEKVIISVLEGHYGLE